jgi:hypothetical protein
VVWAEIYLHRRSDPQPHRRSQRQRHYELRTSWDPNANQAIMLAVDGNQIYVGGNLPPSARNPGTAPPPGRRDWRAKQLEPERERNCPRIRRQHQHCVCGGNSRALAGVRNHLAASTPISVGRTPWDPNANGNVYAGDSGQHALCRRTVHHHCRPASRSLAALDEATGAATAWGSSRPPL